MTVPNWNRCAQTMFDIMGLLDDNRHISLTDTPPEEERADEPEEGTPTQVWGNLGAFLERLDDEWNGSLKVRRRGRGSVAVLGRARARQQAGRQRLSTPT